MKSEFQKKLGYHTPIDLEVWQPNWCFVILYYYLSLFQVFFGSGALGIKAY
ncbi:hypothetical protein [Fictibacillus nanhaiensis]|uniref:hypothetical protein n=1 Tax=Fictibacillus nanhaiensis TaxID=742169 RepID=UPI003C27C425